MYTATSGEPKAKDSYAVMASWVAIDLALEMVMICDDDDSEQVLRLLANSQPGSVNMELEHGPGFTLLHAAMSRGNMTTYPVAGVVRAIKTLASLGANLEAANRLQAAANTDGSPGPIVPTTPLAYGVRVGCRVAAVRALLVAGANIKVQLAFPPVGRGISLLHIIPMQPTGEYDLVFRELVLRGLDPNAVTPLGTRPVDVIVSFTKGCPPRLLDVMASCGADMRPRLYTTAKADFTADSYMPMTYLAALAMGGEAEALARAVHWIRVQASSRAAAAGLFGSAAEAACSSAVREAVNLPTRSPGGANMTPLMFAEGERVKQVLVEAGGHIDKRSAQLNSALRAKTGLSADDFENMPIKDIAALTGASVQDLERTLGRQGVEASFKDLPNVLRRQDADASAPKKKGPGKK